MVVLMAAPSLSCHLISSPHHGFGINRSSNILGSTQYVASWPGLHAKVINYASRVGVTYWSILPLPMITTTFHKPLMILACKKKGLELVSDIGLGSLVKDGYVFRQNFCIKSYEIGPDRKVLVQTLMNYLQETIINHIKKTGLYHDGMGSTPEMSKRCLQWAITKSHLVVDHYPIWGDVVQVDTWNSTPGTYSVSRNWMVRDCKTGKILARASSVMMTMHKKTRRFSKIPDEVRAELKQMLVDTQFIVEKDTRKMSKLDDNSINHVYNDIVMPKWSDLDANQHVNYTKYIGWILESVPVTIMEKYELASMTVEYRRECKENEVLQCHTCVLGECNDGIAENNHIDCQHLLQLEVIGGGGGGTGDTILKGRTKWRPKYENC